MTIQQEAYEKIIKLPEDGIRLILVVADEIARQKGIITQDETDNKNITSLKTDTSLTRKQEAFQELLKIRETFDFPKDFDYTKVVEEAINEKYGFIN